MHERQVREQQENTVGHQSRGNFLVAPVEPEKPSLSHCLTPIASEPDGLRSDHELADKRRALAQALLDSVECPAIGTEEVVKDLGQAITVVAQVGPSKSAPFPLGPAVERKAELAGRCRAGTSSSR